MRSNKTDWLTTNEFHAFVFLIPNVYANLPLRFIFFGTTKTSNWVRKDQFLCLEWPHTNNFSCSVLHFRWKGYLFLHFISSLVSLVLLCIFKVSNNEIRSFQFWQCKYFIMLLQLGGTPHRAVTMRGECKTVIFCLEALENFSKDRLHYAMMQSLTWWGKNVIKIRQNMVFWTTLPSPTKPHLGREPPKKNKKRKETLW